MAKCKDQKGLARLQTGKLSMIELHVPACIILFKFTYPDILIVVMIIHVHVPLNRFMTGMGLKKWSPPNLSFLSVTLAISVMDREDVLDAKIVDLNI